MLLHVVQPAVTIDLAVDGIPIDAFFQNMDDFSAFILFDAIDEIDAVQRAQIMELSAGCGIESRLVENHAKSLPDGLRLHDLGVELEQIRLVVVKACRLHSEL